MTNPWDDLEEYAEALLVSEAEKQGKTLADMGVLSRRRMGRCTCSPGKKSCGRINHFEKYSLEAMRDDLLKQDEDTE